MDLATQRLIKERKGWRKEHPAGFEAKPRLENGTHNIKVWNCKIPGPKDTKWHGGFYPLTM